MLSFEKAKERPSNSLDISQHNKCQYQYQSSFFSLEVVIERSCWHGLILELGLLKLENSILWKRYVLQEACHQNKCQSSSLFSLEEVF
jgi:hypothetical protein